MDGGLKKKLCNPPAEEVARAGDPEVLGLFIGAGRGVELLDGNPKFEAIVHAYVVAVSEVEYYYLTERKALAEECRAKMRVLEAKLLKDVGYEP